MSEGGESLGSQISSAPEIMATITLARPPLGVYDELPRIFVMPFKEATFWYGTLLFGTGLYFWIEGGPRMTAGVILTLLGLAMSAYAVIAHHYSELPKLKMWVAALLLTWAVLGYDIYDRHRTERPWEEPSIRVVDQKFVNTTVLLDNRHFIDPVFDHVTLEYDGTGPIQVDNAKIIGPLRITSPSKAITQTLAIARMVCGGSMELPSTNVPPK